MSNMQQKTTKRESQASYRARVEPLKQNIISLGEKHMDNTLWVIRRWLRDEMDLINVSGGQKGKKNQNTRR